LFVVRFSTAHGKWNVFAMRLVLAHGKEDEQTNGVNGPWKKNICRAPKKARQTILPGAVKNVHSKAPLCSAPEISARHRLERAAIIDFP
jgi:hypothetical protein